MCNSPKKKTESTTEPASQPASNRANSDRDSNTIRIGVNWADGEHTYAMSEPGGNVRRGTVKQTPEAIAELFDRCRNEFPDARIDVCLETSRGPLINALLEHPQVHIHPVNPNALANYRKAFAHGGGKNDPVDADLILRFLTLHQDQLRPLPRTQSLTRELAALCEDPYLLDATRAIIH